MTSLHSIPVTVFSEADEAVTQALLREVALQLRALCEHGKGSLIDVRALPLSWTQRGRLKSALGTGEVAAHVECEGESEVRETAYAGVWWITHYDEAGEVNSELIEVADVPQILRAHPADMATSLAALESELSSARTQSGERKSDARR